jgi:hypothetical protein
MLDFSIKRLEIIELNGTSIFVDIPHKVNLIIGDSGTGKSYMLDILGAVKISSNLISTTNIDVHDIRIWNKPDDINTSISGKLIFIDRYSLIVNKDLVKFIEDSNNKFVILLQSLDYLLDVSVMNVYVLDFEPVNMIFKTELYIGSNYGRFCSMEDIKKIFEWAR